MGRRRTWRHVGPVYSVLPNRDRPPRRYDVRMADDVLETKAPDADDLGIGKQAVRASRERLLNRDGTFNIERRGLPWRYSLHLYHSLVTVPWSWFYAVVVAAYLSVNLLFGAAYFFAGRDAIEGVRAQTAGERLAECFFFSVHTFSTIGYGALYPQSTAANVIVTVEAMAGMFGVALATGLLFARFSRPNANVMFSETALIAPYGGGAAFMFRLVNPRKSQLLDVEASIVMSKLDPSSASGRRFHPLNLERSRIMFFPLHWVVVHPIDEASPLWGYDEAAFRADRPEFLVLLKGLDETFLETIQTRTSYDESQVVWGARFGDMYREPVGGRVSVDISQLSRCERADVGERLDRPPNGRP